MQSSVSPTITSKRSVVLPPHGQHHTLPHHHDPWKMELGLVMILVGVHMVALAYWAYVLYASKEKKRRRGEKMDAKKSTWRTPKEILSSYQKARLGKV